MALSISIRPNVALVLLATDAPASVPPVALARGADDAPAVGEAIRIVGFGVPSADAADAIGPAARRKRSGSPRVDSVDARAFAFHAAPSQTCRGDSGGPAFAVRDGVERLVGITSHGDGACESGAVDARVDVYLDDFLRPNLDGFTSEHAARGGGSGGCAVAAATSPSCSRRAPHAFAAFAALAALALTARSRRPGGDAMRRDATRRDATRRRKR